MPDSGTIQHFSQANPPGEEQGDVPALLRRAAETIQGLGDIQVRDIVFHAGINAYGRCPGLAVYFDSGNSD